MTSEQVVIVKQTKSPFTVNSQPVDAVKFEFQAIEVLIEKFGKNITIEQGHKGRCECGESSAVVAFTEFKMLGAIVWCGCCGTDEPEIIESNTK